MKLLLNNQWEFQKTEYGREVNALAEADWKPVNLPHDWLIYQTEDLYEDGMGWYRRKLEIDSVDGLDFELYFEGVYMDSTLYVNGKEAGEWKNGYATFFHNITEFLHVGTNDLFMIVRYKAPNSRWYSGAGIFRDVYLISRPVAHFVTDSLYVVSRPDAEVIDENTALDGNWKVRVNAEVTPAVMEKKTDYLLRLTIDGLTQQVFDLAQALAETGSLTDVNRENLGMHGVSPDMSAAPASEDKKAMATVNLTVSNPLLWSAEEPNLYDFTLELITKADEECSDAICIRTGFRSFVFGSKKGFWVNGKKAKLQGTCEHHDLGSLGAAYNSSAMRRELELLREMGVNAIRTAHNNPAPDVMDLADEMGFYVMNESYDCWERPKTDYDYARFFVDWHARDMFTWVRRDRNHASLVMWSIGNEIYDTHVNDHGIEITKDLRDCIFESDPAQNAIIGLGSNYMQWEGAKKCAEVLGTAGYNYAERLYNQHHEEHPDWIIFGSETSSTVQSRGIYHFPYAQQGLSDDDEQCSSLGNNTTSWGARSTESCIIAERDHDFSLGQFLWSGFDYIGEPTPYHTRNSYFGQIDTAGFRKDSFYVYASGWTSVKDNPFVHVFPYWDFNPGQPVDVRIATNASKAELLVNGRSLGIKEIDHAAGTVLTADYIVPYEDGEITAIAYDENGCELARETRHSFGETAKLELKQYRPDRKAVAGKDLLFFAVEAFDENGYPVENANNMIDVSVEGPAYLTGLDNGDSTDKDEYKGTFKRLFSGKMLITVMPTDVGEITVRVSSEGVSGACISATVDEKCENCGYSFVPDTLHVDKKDNSIRARKILLETDGGLVFGPDQKEITVKATVLPTNAQSCELIWKVVNAAGIESNLGSVTPDANDPTVATVTAFGDGEFYLRCMTKSGADVVKVISTLVFKAEGIGAAVLNPYELIAGGLWSYGEGAIGNGVDHGASSNHGCRTVIGYERVDFGSYGSSRISVPIFEMTNEPIPFEIWEGIPGAEGSELLLAPVYHKQSIWEVYQADVYELPRRVKGITTICFVFEKAVHLGGFSFLPEDKAYALLNASDRDELYGDTFREEGTAIRDIGNNVTVAFKDMDFGDQAPTQLAITGRTPIDVTTVRLVLKGADGETQQLLEFTHADEDTERVFDIDGRSGRLDAELVFLPGTNFDLVSIQFRHQ